MKISDIRLELKQSETLKVVQKVWKRRLQCCGEVKRMLNYRLSAEVLPRSVPDTRSQGRLRKRWIDSVKEDLHQRGSDM